MKNRVFWMQQVDRRDSSVPPKSPALAEVPAVEVREQLARVLASRQFCNATRLQRFLQVTVEWTLGGKSEELKEYTIGREAFDRRDDYDPRTDSIVRVEAQRLRGKLRDYYAAAGRTDPVIITVNPGSYVPVFAWAIPVATPPASDAIAQPPDPNTVAVLPFANLSPEPEQDYFCDGITEDIINELTSIRDLSVVGRTSSFVFKDSRLDLREIGARLSAGTVIEGSVRKSGEMLRVSAKIIDAASGRALWSESFDRQTGDVFAIEDEIAGAIAGTLRVSLAATHSGERNGLRGLDAYSLYLKGRHAWNRMTPAGFQEAIELYSRAVSLYPDYALPYCGLADAFSWLAFWGLQRPHEAFPKAKQAARESLRLDPLLAHAYTSLGVVLCLSEHAWQDGTAMLRRGIELESGSLGYQMLGTCLLFQVRLEEALRALRRARQLDPLSIRTNRTLGWAYYCVGAAEQAENLLQQALAIDPSAPPTRFMLVEFYLHQGRDEEALEVAEPLLQDAPNSFGWGAAAAALARNGRASEAQEVLDTLDRVSTSEFVDQLPIAVAYAAAGNIDRAFEHLAKAMDDGSPSAAVLLVDPMFEDLRSDPRFDQLAARVNLKAP